MENDIGTKTALLVSNPGIVRDATSVMLDSLSQIDRVELASGALSAIELLATDNRFLLVIDANVPAEEVESLVRWTKQHRPETKCVVLTKSVAELDQARVAGADAAFLRSSSAQQLAEVLWPVDQENKPRS